jgi:hypothetical protein
VKGSEVVIHVPNDRAECCTLYARLSIEGGTEMRMQITVGACVLQNVLLVIGKKTLFDCCRPQKTPSA